VSNGEWRWLRWLVASCGVVRVTLYGVSSILATFCFVFFLYHTFALRVTLRRDLYCGASVWLVAAAVVIVLPAAGIVRHTVVGGGIDFSGVSCTINCGVIY
ncbi:17300_t:CDS:1, partial [Acaulospora morrowiae]